MGKRTCICESEKIAGTTPIMNENYGAETFDCRKAAIFRVRKMY